MPKLCTILFCLCLLGLWQGPGNAEAQTTPTPEETPSEVSFRLAEDQDEKPDANKTIILSWMKEETTSLAELTAYLAHAENTIEQYILLYNITLLQIQKIHDDPDLPQVDKMPPVLTLHRSIPHSTLTLEQIKQRYMTDPPALFSPGSLPRKERE